MPNLIFVGGAPKEAYISANEVGVDQSGGIRVGESLNAGYVYSVVSIRQDFSADDLRADSTITNLQSPISIYNFLKTSRLVSALSLINLRATQKQITTER